MKKYFLYGLMILGSFLLIGCGKYGEKDIVKDLNKKIDKATGYYLTGQLEIMNNEDSYLYNVEVAYEKDDQFRVSLKNKTNNHEQIILKNKDGVYVLTPSLNKSFKFQSEWPYNNSQSYLLQTLLKDIEKDQDRTFEETKDGYIFTTKVNYSNNNNLIKQNIVFDKELNAKEVKILNDKDQVQMKMVFEKIDYKATYDDTYFTLKGNMSETTDTTSTTLSSIVYPMYIPNNTQLTGQEKVTTENGERVILTFSGDSPFMIVQETAKKAEDLLTIPMYGEPYIVTGTVGALSDSSITWISNNVEFYVVSEVLDSKQLLEVANSISVKTVAKQ
ncbi:MAG: outer membrane lipoprotein carrier protein LolA [Bacilli bacterium]